MSAAITHIPAADRIPTRQKAAFAIGVNTDYMATGLLTSVLWMPYFNIGLGISPTLLGIVLMIFRAWDAVSDPLMGNISDNARTRWGRRRPFMLLGALLTGCLFPLFWFMPEGLGQTAQLVYLSVVGICFFTTFTMWSMPYYGLQLELTPDYDERTRLASWMAIFGCLSAFAGSWVLAAVTSDRFINPATGKGDILIGMKTGCWVIAALIILFGITPALFVKERAAAAVAAIPKQPFWQSVKESVRSGPLWALIGISFFLVLGYSSVGTLGQYVNIYYVFDGDLSAASVLAGWKGTAAVIAGVALVPFWTWLGERFDKKRMVMSLLTLSMIGHLLNIFLMRPDRPWLQLIPGLFEASTLSAIWLFLPSMKADAADHDELNTHRRREGSINAFYSWFIKASLTCAMGVGGLVLDLSGFSASLGKQPPEVLSRMFWIFILLPIAIWVVALVIAALYPLDRARMADIRGTLEARRGRL